MNAPLPATVPALHYRKITLDRQKRPPYNPRTERNALTTIKKIFIESKMDATNKGKVEKVVKQVLHVGNRIKLFNGVIPGSAPAPEALTYQSRRTLQNQ